jgi:uncharacterized protein (TIGR03437 family)
LSGRPGRVTNPPGSGGTPAKLPRIKPSQRAGRSHTTACGLLAAAIFAAALALAQDGEAPPAIAQWGITNWASRIPPQLPSGWVAPGSLIRIRGWRLGPAPLGNVLVRIRRGDARVQTAALSADENEIEARVPDDAPLGSAMLQVVKNGQASLEWHVAILESSFGIFSRNGQGWGPGEISNAGAPNSEARTARPGETATLAGTGLGGRTPSVLPQVLVAGRPAKVVRLLPGTAARPGVDVISFDLPADTPEGCYVPVQVASASGLYSNAVTMAVSRSGGPCADPGGWIAGIGSLTARLGTMALLHADLEIGLTPKETGHYPVDAGFASFAEIAAGASANPLFLFPPLETCTTYSGTAGLHSITSPLSALDALPGEPLDAGLTVAVGGRGGERLLPHSGSAQKTYSAVIGGHPPVPGASDLPLFLAPGEYQFTTSGGADVGVLHAKVRTSPPLVWRNREQLGELDRARGATVTWRSSLAGTPAVILIVAMNADSRSGALGVCACLANAAEGSFRIPAYALANIPASPSHPRGFPLNLMILAELPPVSPTLAAGTGVDAIAAFAASISGRTVRFK